MTSVSPTANFQSTPTPAESPLMWEILVPTLRPDGRPIKTRFHRVWDKRIYEMCGGLTILNATKGKWVCPQGQLYAERMIPVRVVATRSQISQIVDFTIEYYEQQAVLCYLVASEVILRYAPGAAAANPSA